MQDFLQQNGQLEQDQTQEPFAFDQIRMDLDGYRVSSPRVMTTPWAAEYDPGQEARMEAVLQGPRAGGFVPNGFSPAEFQKFEMLQRNVSPKSASPASRIGNH